MNMSPISPIKAKKAYLQIVQTVIDRIVEGKLQYGTRLYNEQELMSVLEVSRPTLREALRVMEFLGIVTNRPRKGIIINQPEISGGYPPLIYLFMFEKAGERELFELRQSLQVEMAGLAALRHGEEDLAVLDGIVADMERQIRSDADVFSQLDYDYHQQIIRCAHNTMALKLMNTVGTLIREQLRAIIRAMAPEKRNGTLKFHREIASLIRQGESEKAREKMRGHLKRPYETLSDKPVKFSFTGDLTAE